MTAERNELLEIWKNHVYWDYKGLHGFKDHRKEFKEVSLIFWTLKQKIDDMNKSLFEQMMINSELKMQLLEKEK